MIQSYLDIAHLGTIFLFSFALLIGFYYYFKSKIFKLAPVVAQKIRLIEYYPFSQVVGIVELVLTALSHVIFCLLLLYLFRVNIKSVFTEFTFFDCIYGALIGIGSVGMSVLFCTVAIKLVETFKKDKAPRSLTEWSSISNAGWIRHHKHTIKILPIFFAIVIITLQIGSEETIFRCVLFQAFSPFGTTAAFTLSTLLFIYMQTFHMPSMLSAMFPMIGATVMGIIHGLLYLYKPTVVPLIISHLTFFIFTII